MLFSPHHPLAPAEPIWTVGVPAALEHYLEDPADPRRRRDHALLWAVLAVRQPDPPIEPGKLRSGWSARPDGLFQDAMLTARALRELTTLIDEGNQSVLVDQARAELRLGWFQYDGAIADLQEATRFDPAGDDVMRRWREGCLARMEMARDARKVRHAWRSRLTWKERKALIKLAERMCRYRANLVTAHSADIEFFDFDAPPHPISAEAMRIHEEATALGMVHLGWQHDRRTLDRYGEQALGGVWIDPEGSTMLSVLRVRLEEPTFSVSTLLTDDTVLSTHDYPRPFPMQGGPSFDGLTVNVDRSVTALARLHALRLRITFVDRPGTTYRPVLTREDFRRYDQHVWSIKQAFRREVGISEAEARSTPIHPRYVPLLMAASKRAVQARVREIEQGGDPGRVLPDTPLSRAARRRIHLGF